MSTNKFQLRNILKLAWIYQFYQDIVGATNYDRLLASDYICYKQGQKILDIGCGPSDILKFLPSNVDYLGIDLSPEYIEKARKDFPEQSFICSDFCQDLNEVPNSSFDIILAIGVLHHLTNEQADKLHAFAFNKLAPHGRLITLDGVFTKKQSKTELFFLRNDRGKFVRFSEEYLNFQSTYFKIKKHTILTKVLRIPYTLLLMESQKE